LAKAAPSLARCKKEQKFGGCGGKTLGLKPKINRTESEGLKKRGKAMNNKGLIKLVTKKGSTN